MGTRLGKLLALGALGFGFLLSSCASPDPNTSEDEHVSTIPWDHPEKGENSTGMPNISSNPGGY